MDRGVAFDFEIEFTNGGELQGQDFRLDVPAEDPRVFAAAPLRGIDDQ